MKSVEAMTIREGTGCRPRPFPLHPFKPVHHGHAPVRLQLLRGQQHVVVGLTHARVVLALVAPGRIPPGALCKGAPSVMFLTERVATTVL